MTPRLAYILVVHVWPTRWFHLLWQSSLLLKLDILGKAGEFAFSDEADQK